VHTPKEIIKTERALKNAFVNQIENKGFSLVEILSMCPTNWGMTPVQSKHWIGETMMEYFPLGEYRNRAKEEK
jgi:2-oxoglutarate ferredoxin oxidoreductase subunit beta